MNNKPIGKKEDQEKPDYSLLYYPWLEDTIRVLMHGAKKYGRNNWQHLDEGIYRCASAIMRHAAAILSGEYLDQETGLQHTAHIACEAMFIHYFINQDRKKTQHSIATNFTEAHQSVEEVEGMPPFSTGYPQDIHRFSTSTADSAQNIDLSEGLLRQ